MTKTALSLPAGRVFASLRPFMLGFTIFFLLYVFICGINVMGGGLKILAHCPATSSMIAGLFARASHPVAGLFVGVLITSLVQSSSFTTAMTVSMVASGLLQVSDAIPIVMGANIGTSVTNTLVSIGHISSRLGYRRAFGAAIVHDVFNLLNVAILLPIEIKTGFLSKTATALASVFVRSTAQEPDSALKAATTPVVSAIEHLLGGPMHLAPEWVGTAMAVIGLVGLLASLILLVRALKGLMLARLEAFFARYFFRNWLAGLVLGAMLTALIQSSSVTTSLIVPLVGAGVLRLRQVFPYTLGANIGTTVTALIAAAANPAGLPIAFGHLLFNLIGTCIFLPLRFIPIRIAEWYARLVAARRGLAILYIVVLFFLLPILCIMLLS